MDPYLRRRRLFHLLSWCFILIYQAHLSWGLERVNISNWDEFNNGSSGIKHQKWDTASQGGQHLQMTIATLETNISASSKPLVNMAAGSNLTSSAERIPNISWTMGSGQSSGVTAPSSKTPPRTMSSSQSPGNTAPSKHSQTSPLTVSQFPTASTSPSQSLQSRTENSSVSSGQSPAEKTLSNQSRTSTVPTSQLSNSASAVLSQGSTAQTNNSAINTDSSNQSPTMSVPSKNSQTSSPPGSQSPTSSASTSLLQSTTEQNRHSPSSMAQNGQSPGSTAPSSYQLGSQSPTGKTLSDQSQNHKSLVPASQSSNASPTAMPSQASLAQTSQSPISTASTSLLQGSTEQNSHSSSSTAASSQSLTRKTPSYQSHASPILATQTPSVPASTSPSQGRTEHTKQLSGSTATASLSPAEKALFNQSQNRLEPANRSPSQSASASSSQGSIAQTSQPLTTTPIYKKSSSSAIKSNKLPGSTTLYSQSTTVTKELKSQNEPSMTTVIAPSQSSGRSTPTSQSTSRTSLAKKSSKKALANQLIWLTSTTSSSQSPSSTTPVKNSSFVNAPTRIISDQLKGMGTKSSKTTQSQLKAVSELLNQSLNTPDNQTMLTLNTSQYLSYSLPPNNQSGSNSAPYEQFLTSSVTSNQSGSVLLGKTNNGAISTEQHPVNTSLLTRQVKEALRSSFRRIPGEPCAFPCLNGGQCVQSESCDCSLYQATGHRCQTVPNSGFEREMTCRTWGQYNFETFDGLYYYLPGRCTYTLLRDCEETTQASIIVQVHNDPACTLDPYTCQRSVSLFLPWEGEVRLHATNVTFKGQSLQLPRHIHDLQLEQISQYVLVTQQHGFTLAWEGRSGSVYIKLSPEFVGRTCGLCGNFNADVHDDLKTSYGVLTHEIEMFGNSWVETHPHEERCPMVPSGFPSPCATVESHVLLKVEEVCAVLLDPPFQSCHDFVSPLSYMTSCSNDLCMSDPNGDVVCQVFTEYARACAHAEHPLHEWRQHIPQCVKQCSLGLQHRECISCCPESCNLERTCIDSKLACLDGCYCPDGLIYEDGGCVMPSDCPCEYHGMFYPSGQTLHEECNTCTCVGGVWNCTDYNCPGECSVTGDMYFQSFDGRIYTFPATCQYVLAKSRNSAKFTVTIQNTACGAKLDGACIQSVNLVIDEDPRTEITLSHIGEVFIAGQYRISLPYSDDLFHIQELSSMFVQVRTAFGLRLQYSWKEFRLYLQADELWKDDTVGLCGTFNGNIQDDFLSPSGMIESTPQLFGNAWKVSSACLSSLSMSQLDPCDTHQQAVTYASEMCDVLNQDLFAACHEYLSPTPFHQQCRSDTCKCGTPCLCSSLAHYARHCRRFSIIIDFRSHIFDCAVTCPANMQYGTCVSSCQRRCSSLSVPQHCGEECEEGCVCPQGSFYNHRTHTCVHRSECPCSFLGADYEPGDVIMTSAGVQLCLNGRLVSQTQTGTDRLCPEGQIYQNCSEGEDGLLPGRGVSCERTCESYLLNLTCSSHEPCLAGCVCPPGLLKHGDECFEPAACPCLWKGKEYYPGDRVSSPCYQCVCQHGTFQCVFQPCPSLCTAYGDRHYRTFDGLLFDYVGACKVYLVKSSADVMLSVTAENVDCFESGIICRKSLLINVGRSFVAFDDDTGKPNPSSVIDRKQMMFIWPAGYFTVIHFPEEDVTVLWDRKTTVHVQVGPRWQGKLSGLCGNFDLKTVNEMRTPDNIDSPTPQEFGNSWTATECVNSPDIRHPCTLSPLREPFAKRQCAVLLSEIFQACHPVVDVTWFYMNCLADTCACSRGGDCECFCTSVAAYAQRCCHQGVPVDWRSPSLCPYDCEFYNKVLGKGPFRLFTFGDRTTLLAASKSSGFVFVQSGNISDTPDIISLFMMTPGLSRARPHDTSRVSFEAADRPNYFLSASPNGQLTLAKWQESEAFWERATFILRRNTWIPGYDSLESHAKPGFFLYAAVPRLYLIKYRHLDSFRKATLFKMSGPNPDTPPAPRCQWRYDACVSPCFKTCSDPFAEACITIPQVEGCLPVCPPHMVLDEVTRRCVYIEDCIKFPVAVQPVTPSAAQPTTASTTASTSTLNTTASTTAASAAPPHTASTTKITSTVPEASLHTSSSETPPAIISPSASPEPSSTIEPPSPPAVPTAVRPEVVEPLSTVKVTVAPPTTIMSTTEWISGSLSSAVSPFGPSTSRTSSTSFTTTPLFWLTSSTKSTDSLQPLFTTTPVTTEPATTTAALTTTSLEGTTTSSTPIVVQTTEATTHSTGIALIVTASSPSSALVLETSVITEKTIVPSTTTSAHTDTRSKSSTVEGTIVTTSITSGSPSTAFTTAAGLPASPSVVTGTTALPEIISTKMTELVTPSAPFTTTRTTPHIITPSVTTERMLHTTFTDLTTPTTTAPELTTTTLTHFAPSTHVPSPSTSATTDWRTITKKVSVTDSPASGTIQAETTTAPLSKSTVYTERTSWSAAVPVTDRTTITSATATSRPPEIPKISTVSTVPIITTSLIETTPLSKSPITDSSTSPPTTISTSEPWRPSHWQTSSTPVYRATVETTPEVKSETVVHVVASTATTAVPHIPLTTEPTVASATSASTPSTAQTRTLPEISTAQFIATTTKKLATPLPLPMHSSPETKLTTAIASAPPTVATTTQRPVIIQLITETMHPLTGRVQVSTTSATTSHPSSSPLGTTTSTAPPRTTTILDKVTTRLVSTSRPTSAPTTTIITQMTTLRTTPRLPVTTRITPRTTSTERATIRPFTARVTVATRPAALTTRSTTVSPPTVTPSSDTTTTSEVTTTTITTSAEPVTTAKTTKPPDTTTAEPHSTTITAPLPLPTLTTLTTSTAIPTSVHRESTTSEETSTTTETNVSPSASQPVTPVPDVVSSTQKLSIPTSATTSRPSAIKVQTTVLDKVDRTSPSETTSPALASPPTPVETTSHTTEGTTSITLLPTRMCTPPYAEVVDDCTKYICVNNQLVLFNKSQSCPYTADPPNCGLLGFAILVNGDKCCPKWDCPCRCTMFPDLNVITFDGNSVAIYKAASFIVTQLPNETVSVLVQECPADSQSPLFWNFTNLCLVALNITHKSNHIIINRLQRRLYVNSRYAKPRFKKYGFEIYDTGNMYLIRSPAGLKLQWYHSTGMMVIDTDSSSNKLPTMGLCGFCDGDPSNDLILANGTTVGESEDPAVFIDSWQVPNTTSYISHSRRRELNCSTSDCSSCFFMLQNQAFTPCHAFVPPTTFCEVWVRDLEYVNNQCVALAAYVASCHKFNICIEWRSPNYCPFVCPDTLRYQACLPACTSQSCPNHDFDSDPDQCSGLTEGCVCPEGTLLHRPYSALCIPPDKCACTDSGGVPRSHGEVWKASKDACCMYHCDNDTIIPVEYNCSSMVAPVCRRAGEVIISLADDTSCCPQKVCVCNQSLCDQLPPECKYGEKLVSYYRQDSCCPDYVCECDPVLCESDIPTCRDDQILIASRAEGSCCLADICMCAPCVETPPLCQDGEILTVDSNTTDRCCPTYHCVCEPYRCPQLTCPVGMSVVSVSNPGHCCPNQTCECSCEKIASPKCGLGEAAQLDRAFLADPQNQCACKRYKCVREAVCVFGERGVLRPGQTLVERGDDGLCHSRQCSRNLDPASGFHVLRTFSVNCSNQCQPNQIYVPPKDQSTCCGVCKNISCIYEHDNGTTGLYKPGRSWVSNCMKFDCTDTVAGPTLISYSFSCPPFNETECMKIGGTVVSYMDGCCKTCKEDGKSCQKVTVRMTIRKNDCRSNRPVNIVSCDGKCPSASIYNYNINTYARFCKCCRETGLQRRSVQLYCSSNSTWVSYTIQEPTDCSCQWS
ncbi:otogelin isoform X2 [Oreochromis niloticus]|uniref:otogelin isoform X2 n=1 Tax=Oreochromis niloticus TaxID=8128 RepID=UPI000904E201|nr:otogelin isoform X2 [Oreochromis niloticus]